MNDMTPDELRGVDDIIFLQSLRGIKTTHEHALKVWRELSDYMQSETTDIARLLREQLRLKTETKH